MFMWKENIDFSSVEGGSSGLQLRLFLEGSVHGPRLDFKSAEEDLGLDLDFKAT